MPLARLQFPTRYFLKDGCQLTMQIQFKACVFMGIPLIRGHILPLWWTTHEHVLEEQTFRFIFCPKMNGNVYCGKMRNDTYILGLDVRPHVHTSNTYSHTKGTHSCVVHRHQVVCVVYVMTQGDTTHDKWPQASLFACIVRGLSNDPLFICRPYCYAKANSSKCLLEK